MITADYVHTRLYHDWIRLNSNLIQNPANPEFNYSPSTKHAAGQGTTCPTVGVTQDSTPYTSNSFNVCAQAFTNINQFFTPNDAGSIYDALQLGLRHSLQYGFTSGVAYTYSRLKDSTESPFYYPNKPFVNGIHDEWANGLDDQRHTLTVTGDYAIKYGLVPLRALSLWLRQCIRYCCRINATHRVRPEHQPYLRTQYHSNRIWNGLPRGQHMHHGL